MKKYFIGLAVIGLLLAPAYLPAQALSISSDVDEAGVIAILQAQINQLQQAIRELPQQKLAPQAPSLRLGASGQEVKDLQSFLKKEGYFPPTLEPTGYFGNITKDSLEKFQLKQGIFSADAPVSVGRGEVGQTTRDVISYKQVTTATQAPIPTDALPLPPTSTGGGTIQLPAGYSEKIQLLSPNGGETWQIGKFYTVQYSLVQSQPGVAPAKVLVYLEQGYPPGSPKVGVNSAILLGIGDGSGSLSVVLPSWPGPSALSKIRVCGGLGCEFTSDVSDGFFTVTAPPILTNSVGGWSPYTISDASIPQPTTLSTPVTPGLPAGCTSTTGFSPTTGVPCSTVATLPVGCTSTSGFSSITGASCSIVFTL